MIKDNTLVTRQMTGSIKTGVIVAKLLFILAVLTLFLI